MLEAMYGVEFRSQTGDFGYGVVVLKSGRVLGGDSSCVYLGEYAVEDGTLTATVEVTNDHKMQQSIFGNLDRFSLQCSAKLGDDGSRNGFVMHGKVVGRPEMQIVVKFTRRAELP